MADYINTVGGEFNLNQDNQNIYFLTFSDITICKEYKKNNNYSHKYELKVKRNVTFHK